MGGVKRHPYTHDHRHKTQGLPFSINALETLQSPRTPPCPRWGQSCFVTVHADGDRHLSAQFSDATGPKYAPRSANFWLGSAF